MSGCASGGTEIRMGKEISKRTESRVLYEPPEPLFPDGIPPRRIKVGRIVALVIFVSLVIFIWTFAVSGKDQKEQESESERVTERGGESEKTSETNDPGIESESHPEPKESESETETERETANNETGSVTEEKADGGSSEESTVAKADLSQIEKGEGYVVNYSDKTVDTEGLLDRGFVGGESAGGAAPLVLIIHTHTSEEYAASESDFRGLESVVSAGEAMSASANQLGIPTVHCTVIHDGKDRNAYANARDTILMMLEIYPSIKYVVDVHRLSLYDGELPIKTVSGCKDGSAQIRLTVGAREEYGDWQEDLSLSLALRKSLNENGERVCMPVVVSPSLPNGDVSRYYIMADIGAVGNTTQEAIAAGKRLGVALADVLLGR